MSSYKGSFQKMSGRQGNYPKKKATPTPDVMKSVIHDEFVKFLAQFLPLMFKYPKGINTFMSRRLKDKFGDYISHKYIDSWSNKYTTELLGQGNQDLTSEIKLEFEYLKNSKEYFFAIQKIEVMYDS